MLRYIQEIHIQINRMASVTRLRRKMEQISKRRVIIAYIFPPFMSTACRKIQTACPARSSLEIVHALHNRRQKKKR